MSDYDEGRRVGLFLAKHPHMAHYILGQHQQELEDAQANSAASVAADAIGSNPYGEAAPIQQNDIKQPYSDDKQQNDNYGQFHNEILAAAQKTGLSPQEIYAIQQAETGNRPDAATAQSPTGPIGAMQLSSAAATDVGLDPSERTDPAKNIMAGAEYYRRLKAEYGNNAHAAYYDGPGKAATGQFSPEALAYQSKFNEEPSSQGYVEPNSGATALPQEYYSGSQFRPNGMVGGSGILGQDMDPVRRAHYDAIQKLLRSNNPLLAQMGLKMLNDSQQAHIKDIERTAKEKELNLLGLDPKSAAYRRIALQSIMRPSAQTIINNGQQRQAAIPMSDEEMQSFGLPTGPGHSKYIVDKNGMPQAVEVKTGTEDQAKNATFAKMSNDANNVINSTQHNVDYTKIGMKHLVEQVPWAGDFLGGQVINPELSEDEQKFDVAAANFVAAINRKESGASVTPFEWSMARYRFLPGKGDKEPVLLQKQKNREMATRMMMESGGLLGQSQLEAFDKSIKEAEKQSNTKSGNMPKLPQLPAGHKWVD